MPRLTPIPLRQLLVVLVLVLCGHALLLPGEGSVWSLAQRAGAVQRVQGLEVRSIAAAPAPAVAALPVDETPIATKPVVSPIAKKRLPPPAKLPENTPPVPINSAQAAPDSVAIAAPIAEPLAIAAAPEAAPAPAPPDVKPEPSPSPEPAPAPLNEPIVAQALVTAVQIITSATAPGSATAAVADSASASTAATGAPLELQFPPSGSFAYAATILRGVQPQTGAGTLEWTSDGRAYQLRLVSSALFITLLSQTSVGQLGADGLLPERFGDKRFNRSEKAAHFTRSADTSGALGHISFSGNQKQAPLQRGAQDRLSVLVQLAGLVAANPAQFAAAGKVAVQVASAEGADTWLFVLQGEEALQLPAGKTTSLHLVRHPRQEYDARLELWLAPELGYLPVRIKLTEANGDSSDLQLRSPALKAGTKPM